MGVLDLVKETAALFGARSRRSWAGTRRAHIEFRNVDATELADFEREVRRLAQRLDGLEGVEVNPHVHRVVFAFSESAPALGQLEALVKRAEDAAQVDHRDFIDELHGHPADEEPERRLRLELAAETVSLAVGLALRVSPISPSGLAGNGAAVLAVSRAIPRIKESLDRRLGVERGEVSLNLVGAGLQTLAQRPIPALVEVVQKRAQLREQASRRELWQRRERELCRTVAEYDAREARSPERPVPLPRGPIEEYTDRAWVVSLGGFGVSFLTTRSFQRAAAALFGALPRPARLGRESFAANLGRSLASRGVLVMEPTVLRRLDRIDCLVLPGELVARDQFEVGEIVVGDGIARDEAATLVDRLFDAERPAEKHRRGEVVLGPAGALESTSSELAGHQSRLAKRGALVLGLERAGRLQAIVEMRIIPRTGVEELIAAAHQAQMRVAIATSDPAVVERVNADDIIGEGPELQAGIHRLQREGRGVCLVSRRDGLALAAADCGIGLVSPDGATPWGAHLICHDDLGDVRFLIQAFTYAEEIAKQSVNIALATASLGALVSAGGFVPMTARRAISLVNLATLVAQGNGTRSALVLERSPLPLPRDRTPWHALDADGVLHRLNSTREGLKKTDLARRVKLETQEPSQAYELLQAMSDELFNPLAPLLAAGAGLSAVVGSLADAGMVAGVVGLNSAVGGAQRFLAERAIRELARTSVRKAVAFRDGQPTEVDAEELVPGDVVELQAGDVVPADCRVLVGESLQVDASGLTGESLPVPKGADPSYEPHVADRSSMLFDGTTIAAGRAVAVVVATGDATEARRAGPAASRDRRETGVERRLQNLVDLTGPVAIGSGVGLVGVGLLRGRQLKDIIGSAVSLAVASVPEGLPLLVTAAQLAAARRLSGRGALVRNPHNIEALGRVEVLCLDKTGTLTEGRIELAKVADSLEVEASSDPSPARRRVLAAALRATPESPVDALQTDPTDAALLRAAATLGLERDEHRPGWRLREELAFEAARAYHAVLGEEDGGHCITVKGAPERLIPRCSSVGGEPLDVERRLRLATLGATLARTGLRVLAVAERSTDATTVVDATVADLDFVGFLAFADPVRSTAAESLRRMERAGVRTVMLTGDHPDTAEAVAAEIGLMEGGKLLLSGADLQRLSDDELDAVMDDVAVFARVTPPQKVRVVRSLMRTGKVVAMVGDGANDAPAIRLANIGIAIGERSTSAARSAADVVITDERIETIVEAVIEGRAMWASVRDAVAILMGGNFGEIAFTLAAGMVDGKPPLNARQLLLVNLLTDVAPAMAIALRAPSEKTLENVASEGPDASLGDALSRGIVSRAGITALGAGGAWAVGRVTGGEARARTIALIALVATQLGQTLRSGEYDRTVMTTGLVSAGALAAIIQTPGLSHFFGCRPLGPLGWTTALGSSLAATSVSQTLPEAVEEMLRKILEERGIDPNTLLPPVSRRA